MNDMTPPQDEASFLAQAHEEMQAEVKAGTFGVATIVRLAEALERLPEPANADARIQLVSEAATHLGNSRLLSNAPALARLIRAAHPSDGATLTPASARLYFNMSGVMATVLGRPAQAVRLLSKALPIAEQLADPLAISAVWNNLTQLVAGAGNYEDAIAFSTKVERTLCLAGGTIPGASRMMYFAAQHRANALHRLGRLDAALADFSLAAVFAFVTNQSEAAEVAVHVAELLIERGDHNLARGILDRFGETIPAPFEDDAWGTLNLRRVRALLVVAQGHTGAGLEGLEAVLEEALRVAPESSGDDIVVDTLYSLEFAYRLAGDVVRARDVVHRIGARLRTNAERALAAIAEEPALFALRDPQSALRELDGFIARRALAAGSRQAAAAATLQQLIALAAGAGAIEDPTGEHGVRVAALARAVASAMELDDVTARLAMIAGLVHDAGKFGVPHAALASRGPLSVSDQALLDAHADNGAGMIERAAIPDRGRIAETVRLHHQPYDGVGARSLLKGDAIPIEARIVAACDHFDALVMGRPRRPAVPIEEALCELLRQSGRDFDPRVVEVLIATVRQLRREHSDVMAHLAEDADQYDFTSARRVFRRAAA